MKMKDLSDNADLPKADKVYIKDAEIERAMKEELTARGLNFHSGIVQESFKSMKKSLEIFYKKRKEADTVGFPKFKDSKSAKNSFFFKNQGISWNDSYFKIMKQKIKWKYHRKLPVDKVNQVLIEQESDGKWYIVLNITFDSQQEYEKSGLECGIDMNIGNIAVTESSGKSYLIKLEDFSKNKYSKQYVKLQQQLSRRYKKRNFSKNTKRLQKQANKVYTKIKNKKEDAFHKISNDLTNKFDRISLEDLKIKEMKESNKKFLNRLISDVSWDSLLQKIKYKSEMKNKIVREIHPAYTSQRCHSCGFISKNNRKSQSDFVCQNCNHTENADLNSSRNIIDYDSWSLEQKTKIATWQPESF